MTLRTAALVAIAIAFIVVACGGGDGQPDEPTPTTQAVADATSTPSEEGSGVPGEQSTPRTLVEGECITDLVEIVACESEAAKHQVKKVFDLDYLGTSFPGDFVVQSQAAQGCGISVTNFFVPTAEDWASGLNIVICLGRVTR